MLNTMALIQIQTQFGMYVGKILHHDMNRIKLSNVCILRIKTMGEGQPPRMNLKSLGHDIVFYGAMVVLEVQEQDPIFKKYTKETSNIVIVKT